MKFSLKLLQKPTYDVVLVGQPTQYTQRLLQHELNKTYTVVPIASETELPTARQYIALSMCASARLKQAGLPHIVAVGQSASAILTAID